MYSIPEKYVKAVFKIQYFDMSVVSLTGYVLQINITRIKFLVCINCFSKTILQSGPKLTRFFVCSHDIETCKTMLFISHYL